MLILVFNFFIMQMTVIFVSHYSNDNLFSCLIIADKMSFVFSVKYSFDFRGTGRFLVRFTFLGVKSLRLV